MSETPGPLAINVVRGLGNALLAEQSLLVTGLGEGIICATARLPGFILWLFSPLGW